MRISVSHILKLLAVLSATLEDERDFAGMSQGERISFYHSIADNNRKDVVEIK